MTDQPDQPGQPDRRERAAEPGQAARHEHVTRHEHAAQAEQAAEAELRPLWSDRLELGEGIRQVAGRIVLTDILSGRLLGAPEGVGQTLELLARLPVPLGAVAPVAGRPGHWIGAAGTGVALIGPDGGTDWLARPAEGAPVRSRMNDGAADPEGRFWAGSMAYDATPDAGALYRVDRDGAVHRVLDGITVPNGPAFTADGTAMYLADSARGLIRRYPLDPASGELGEGTVFTALGGGSPDGMAIDEAGGLWCAVWGAAEVRRYLPDGTLDRVLTLPAAQPAGVCLGGPDGRSLFVTTARIGLTSPGPLDGAVFTARVGTPGLPVSCYRPL
ncbi:calcium-binding protein [Streptomyces sulfonofaciens]|uniref:Calcium-binding protein n=1 Tax=Streptomyces sulfonofaciens TaxID=68272 RepID=A0A919KVA4_9ACTN|nr:SMP-30/gluconolactonase/LRE family protein [Streptomyces sulfonofaciens]GHH73001.1 calcium-binding protein [Streptomyces sulfonofaciens]